MPCWDNEKNIGNYSRVIIYNNKNTCKQEHMDDTERTHGRHVAGHDGPEGTEIIRDGARPGFDDKYRTLLENASDAIIISDTNGKFLEVNKRAEALLGYAREELAGMTPIDIHPPEEGEKIWRHFRDIVEGKIDSLYDTVILRKDGKVVPVDITGCPVEYKGTMYAQAIFRDISAHKRLEEELKVHRDHLEKLVAERIMEIAQEMSRRKEKEAQYLALVESINGYVWETDAEAHTTYISSRVKDILGYDPDEIIGKRPLDLMPPDEVDRAAPVFKSIISRRRSLKSFEETVIHRNGRLVHLEVNGAPFFDDKGALLGYRGSAHDVTRQKEAFEELKLREEELRLKSQTLEEVNAALRVLLKQRDKDRRDIEEGFLKNIKQIVLPYIYEFQKNARDPAQKSRADIVLANLNEIMSPFLNAINRLNFTPKEIQVASFIRDGKTTKETAELMGVKRSAIDSHRDNIRKKLGLNKAKANLRTCLLSLD